MAEVDIDPEAMKPRRFNPAMVVLGLALFGLGGGLLWFGVTQSAEKMTVLERMEEQKDIFLLPAKDQLPRWTKWAGDENADPDLRAEALAQLALLGGEQAAPLAIEALKTGHKKVRGTCAQVLAHLGREKAGDAGRAALVAALPDADVSYRRQVVWALVELGESSIFDTAMTLYKAGQLTTVQRLEGGGAFDPLKITQLVSLDVLVKRAGDESPAVRQLVATLLSEDGDAKWTDALITLVQDKDLAVAREAASGLGRIGTPKARDPLLKALKAASDDDRQKFVEALRDGIGGPGLVLALDTVVASPEPKRWFQYRQLFDIMHILADPRVGDSLVQWLETNKPFKHWETEAGIVLAEVGDVRAAKYLGMRMALDNRELYTKAKFWQADAGGHMTRNDRPRVVGARMLADLAVIHGDKHAELREWAEDNSMKWLTERPQPHANGLRFLAAVGSERGKEQLRIWAFPNSPLPAEGAQPPFPQDYIVAQSALRYLGRMHDSRDKLLAQYDRKKDKRMDITQQGLEGAGLAMLGMVLRAVAVGASDGLAEWGPQKDKQVQDKLIEFIEDQKWHENAREHACRALGWVANEDTLVEVVQKVAKYAASAEPKEQFIGACYAATLTRRPVPSAVGLMVDLLRPELQVSVRTVLARAIGVSGVPADSEAEKKLMAMLADTELRNAAALALILGGSTDAAARTAAAYAEPDRKLALGVLKDMYFRAFGYWSSEDFKRGHIYRWVANAHAIARVKIGDASQDWARQRLRKQFENLDFDNGPHSETRVVLRYHLVQEAKNGDANKKRGAIMTLKFMREQGSLMALKDESGETGQLAAQALHELMNPRLVVEEDLKHLQEDKKKE